MPREMNLIGLVKGKERFIFIYDDGEEECVIEVLREFATDSRSIFTWFDAATLTERIRELSNTPKTRNSNF